MVVELTAGADARDISAVPVSITSKHIVELNGKSTDRTASLGTAGRGYAREEEERGAGLR